MSRRYLGKSAQRHADEFRRDATPEEWRAYERGMEDAHWGYPDTVITDIVRDVWDEHCESFCVACLDASYPRDAVINDVNYLVRVAAFGAIRRAAELARRVDCQCGCHGDLDANAMRRAIRAAIGSDKA